MAWKRAKLPENYNYAELEGRNVLTHNGTSQAIYWLSGTRAHMGVRRAQTFPFVTFHCLLGASKWTKENADFAV